MLNTQEGYSNVSHHFFQPLTTAITRSVFSRSCPRLDDGNFLRLGVSRVLSQATSGRDFLQSHGDANADNLRVSTFFECLKSKRRLSLCSEVNRTVARELDDNRTDPFADHPELAAYDLYAGDGHYHSCAAHDIKRQGRKHPVGHFFLFNLRSQGLHHLDAAQADIRRKGEHDMHLLKRMEPSTLRMGAATGRKVLYVWDRAGVDFRFWYRAKQGSGLYFLSREKENQALQTIGINLFDADDPRNEGVLADEMMGTSNGVSIRRVIYRDPVSLETYRFLTSEFQLPPGLIALLYKCRWHIEKAFDQSRNKLEETKAWASSHEAKCIQAQLICITHNLVLLLESHLETHHRIRNTTEIARRKKRLNKAMGEVHSRGGTWPFVHYAVQRLTVRSVKFIRWLRSQLQLRLPWDAALARLRHVYDTF